MREHHPGFSLISLSAPIRQPPPPLHPPRPRRVSKVEVVDHHPAGREGSGRVADRRPHHLDPALRNPILVALVERGHDLALEQPIQPLRLGPIVDLRALERRGGRDRPTQLRTVAVSYTHLTLPTNREV